MRTTVRLDDDLLEELRRRARQEKLSLTRLINRILRAGLAASQETGQYSGRFRQRTHPMGLPRMDLNKALAVASALEDEEILPKLASGK